MIDATQELDVLSTVAKLILRLLLLLLLFTIVVIILKSVGDAGEVGIDTVADTDPEATVDGGNPEEGDKDEISKLTLAISTATAT
ncbi:MAG: hypothetical protein AAF585_02085 [Verrucomicrobiota bacterium]